MRRQGYNSKRYLFRRLGKGKAGLGKLELEVGNLRLRLGLEPGKSRNPRQGGRVDERRQGAGGTADRTAGKQETGLGQGKKKTGNNRKTGNA